MVAGLGGAQGSGGDATISLCKGFGCGASWVPMLTPRVAGGYGTRGKGGGKAGYGTHEFDWLHRKPLFASLSNRKLMSKAVLIVTKIVEVIQASHWPSSDFATEQGLQSEASVVGPRGYSDFLSTVAAS